MHLSELYNNLEKYYSLHKKSHFSLCDADIDRIVLSEGNNYSIYPKSFPSPFMLTKNATGKIESNSSLTILIKINDTLVKILRKDKIKNILK